MKKWRRRKRNRKMRILRKGSRRKKNGGMRKREGGLKKLRKMDGGRQEIEQ